jgi:SOS-response transcriptional repressor LexA
MPRKRRKRESSTEREEYRKSFGVRLVEAHGDVGIVARAADADPATIWSWRQPGEGLPDLFQGIVIARAKKASPAWLAFGLGPRDPSVAEHGFALSAEIEKHAGLKEVITSYCRGTEEDRAAIRWAASKVSSPLGLLNVANVARFLPVEPRPMAMSRRDELAVFTIARRQRKGVGAPHWLNLAAGPGGPLERCKDYYHFEELPDTESIHSARIRGESMKDTLHPGDVVVLRTVGDAPIKLPTLSHGVEKNPLTRLKVDVPDDTIWVLQINGEEPTVKRVRYYIAGADWHLMIHADNPAEPGYPRVITRQDEVTFWARVIGVAKEE